MNLLIPRFHELFRQLGLSSEEYQIRQFIRAHSPLPAAMRLADAPFWSPTQSNFLREALLQDSDWAVLVDQLNAALHAP